jgi:hypothetical protein
MKISVHYSTDTTPEGYTDVIVGETHSHVETLCLIGLGQLVAATGAVPTDYSIWGEDPRPNDPLRRNCLRAIGTHGPHINKTEAEAFPTPPE